MRRQIQTLVRRLARAAFLRLADALEVPRRDPGPIAMVPPVVTAEALVHTRPSAPARVAPGDDLDDEPLEGSRAARFAKVSP